jgi:hypothetical protein
MATAALSALSTEELRRETMVGTAAMSSGILMRRPMTPGIDDTTFHSGIDIKVRSRKGPFRRRGKASGTVGLYFGV